MMLSIEGPDMCGKSEIAKELSRRLQHTYYKNSGEWSADLRSTEYFKNLLLYGGTLMTDLLCQIRPDVVLDRYYPSEFAYSKVFKRETDISVLERIDKKFAESGGRHIICRRKSYKGLKDDLHDYVDSSLLEELDSAYEDFALRTNCPVLTLWVDDEDLEREMKDIFLWINA